MSDKPLNSGEYDKYTCANRETIVESVVARKIMFGDMGFPTDPSFQKAIGVKAEDGASVWMVYITMLAGVNDRKFACTYDASDLTKEEVEAKYSENDFGDMKQSDEQFNEIVGRLLEIRGYFSVESDVIFSTCYDILEKSGVIDSTYRTSSAVYEFLGTNRMSFLGKEFGENWQAAAQLEYCERNFPKSSLAHLASRVFYNLYIEEDDFSVGYLFREIKFILGGAESIALQAQETRSKAGIKGARISKSARDRRVQMFWDEIESLGQHYPKFGVAAIEAQAFENAIQRDEKLWSEGKGAREKYLSEFIRSKEPYKSRYFALFGKTA